MGVENKGTGDWILVTALCKQTEINSDIPLMISLQGGQGCCNVLALPKLAVILFSLFLFLFLFRYVKSFSQDVLPLTVKWVDWVVITWQWLLCVFFKVELMKNSVRSVQDQVTLVHIMAIIPHPFILDFEVSVDSSVSIVSVIILASKTVCHWHFKHVLEWRSWTEEEISTSETGNIQVVQSF